MESEERKIQSPQKLAVWDCITHIGGRNENQDLYGYCQLHDGSFLFVVCDGMGGMRGGSIASREAVRTILEDALYSQEQDPVLILTNALKKANAVVFRLGQTNEELRGMGTTAVALLLNGEKATAAHTGDSRIYQVRGKHKVFRTFDHSLVFDLVRRGSLTEEQARLSADSNIINRALGMKADVEVEINDHLPYRKGDRFMLCTDGISGMVEEKKLLKMVVSKKEVEDTLQNMAHEINELGHEAGGGHDNMTAILIEMCANSDIRPVRKKKKKVIVFILALLLLVSIGLYYCLTDTGCPVKNWFIKKESLNGQKDFVDQQDKIFQVEEPTIELEEEPIQAEEPIQDEEP